MPRNVILDMDPGHDDAIALLLACAAPELAVLGLTVVAGNQTLDKTERNARKVLSYAGLGHVPVAAGMARPLVRELVTAGHVHGESGLDGPALPEPTVPLDPRHGVDLLIDLLRAADGPVTLVPTGPLTNVALALLKAPEVKTKVERIVLMGGAVGQGNVTPSAEFNIYVDPEAAHVVFSSGLPITMVGLEVTHQALVTPADVERIRALGGRVALMVAELIDFYSRFHRERLGWPGAPVHDACAVAEVVRPGIVATRPMHVAIELRGEHTVGRTVCDLRGVTGRPPNADVGLGIDRAAFLDLLLAALGRYP